LVGEYNWTGKYWQEKLYGAVAIPFILGLLVFLLPRRWFPLKVPLLWKRKKEKVNAFDTRNERPIWRGFGYADEDVLVQSNSDPPEYDLPTPLSTTKPPLSPFPYTPPVRLEPPQPLPKRSYLFIRKWHIFSLFVIISGIVAIVIWQMQPSSLGSFLNLIENKSTSDSDAIAGDLYWSLFGRTSDCCSWVEHGDGYTIHYPGTSGDMRSRVLELTRHAWKMKNQTPFFGPPQGGGNIKEVDLPAISCPQNNLTLTSPVS